ncbi:hypothetical protein Q7301_02425 [Glaesserella parasuis]|uniref:hypothetical protein n=1 Tax=Glaesserella parasuis TaxID=738 RepID=UPI0027171CBE|nr:hypothetical protein [Glaesserella parasuis]MDP0242219.1 hypothetical protein [Glaesserella parasuis]MEE3690305.1 hypothetical protein [Glaesserella parasuis]
MTITKTIYGNENLFVSIPECVRWLAINYELSESLSAQILEQKILFKDGVCIDVYGSICEGQQFEFYLVANREKAYYFHEIEYIRKLIDFLKTFGAYAKPREDDLTFFYNQYYIKKDDLDSLLISNDTKEYLDTESKKQEFIKLKEENARLKKELECNESSNSRNKKNAFIKSLLYIHYGAEVAEKPRSHIYDPNMSEKSRDGKIQKDFELHGLAKHLPSGKTLENWLKGIELDTQD